MKQKIMSILKASKIAANDRLYRAELMFDPAQRDLNKEYGESGKTCQQILDEYRASKKEIENCIAWLESVNHK